MWIYRDKNGIPHIEIGPKEVAENIPALLMEALQANSCPLNINPMIDDIGAILKEHRGNENNNAKQTGA